MINYNDHTHSYFEFAKDGSDFYWHRYCGCTTCIFTDNGNSYSYTIPSWNLPLSDENTK